MPDATVLITSVLGLGCYLVGDLLVRGGEAWWWRKLSTSVQRARRRYHGWTERRRKEGIEAGLDKVAELVSRTEDCKASHPERWPLELKHLWSEAATQMIDRKVGWSVAFAKYEAEVWAGDNVMQVRWPDLTIHGWPNAGWFDVPSRSFQVDRRWREDPEATALR